MPLRQSNSFGETVDFVEFIGLHPMPPTPSAADSAQDMRVGRRTFAQAINFGWQDFGPPIPFPDLQTDTPGPTKQVMVISFWLKNHCKHCGDSTR